jgi:hypothetical protein
MAKKEAVPEEEPVVVENRKASKDVQMLLSQYFEQFAPSVHPYTRAYVSANYRGMLKTKDEWESELKGKL